jgi:hypothetical protein
MKELLADDIVTFSHDKIYEIFPTAKKSSDISKKQVPENNLGADNNITNITSINENNNNNLTNNNENNNVTNNNENNINNKNENNLIIQTTDIN